MPIRSRREIAPRSDARPEAVEPSPQEEKVPPKVTALVVSYNRMENLRRAIQALEASEGRETMQIMVVDNGSRDGSAQLESEFPNTRFIRMPKNFGLTKALNIGLRASEGEYVFLLHEDTEVEPNAARALIEILDTQPDAVAACPLLVDAEGRPAPQLADLPPGGPFRSAEVDAEPYAVTYATGAALMVRAFFVKGMGQIDERYGQYGSDAEIAYQVYRVNKKTLLVPTVRAIHHGRSRRSGLRDADFRMGVAVYLGKHRGIASGIAARVGNVLGALFGGRFGEFRNLAAGQKIDGTQFE